MFSTLISQIVAISFLEIVAAVCGVLSVWFARKENILVFPIGIISTAIYVYILFVGKLYAVSGINLYYTLVSVYGWYMWSRVDSNDEKLKVTNVSRKSGALYIVTTCVIAILIFILLRAFTQNDSVYQQSYIIYLDTFTSALFCVAMILEARKKVESWILWIIADVVSIPFYYMQGYLFTSLQYVIFSVLAVMALIEWRKRADTKKAE